jgi:hypothetical protein
MLTFGGAIISTGGPDVRGPHVRRVIKDANFEVVRSWHKLFVPEHFQTSANARYAYSPRKGDGEPQFVPKVDSKGRTKMVRNRAYSWRKRRQKGHNRPLVWSGQSERAATAMIRVSGNSRQARGVLAMLPRYFYMYRLDVGNRINKARELTKTTAAEVAVLAHIHKTFVTKTLQEIRDRKVKRVRA